jgi:GNAT superfamily N-acetyltransferase
MASPVIISYLEMQTPQDLIVKPCPDPEFTIKEAHIKQWQVNRFFYQTVGQAYLWRDRNVWTDVQWAQYAEADNLRTFIGYHGGMPAGYYELRKDEATDVEIVCLGLLPKFIGQGYGHALIADAISRGWEWHARRVWLNTCTKDHPNALRSYLATGLKLYKQERKDGH